MSVCEQFKLSSIYRACITRQSHGSHSREGHSLEKTGESVIITVLWNAPKEAAGRIQGGMPKVDKTVPVGWQLRRVGSSFYR